MIDVSLLKSMNGKWCLNGVPFDGVSKSLTGTFRWHRDGRYHREDGPAVEFADGTKHWHMHGNLHREGGPAIEEADGTTAWFIHGERIFTWKRYRELSTLSPEQQMVVKLKYGEQLK